MNHKTDMQADLKRIASELRAYNPAADEYKGEHIHKVWAREIEAALAGQSAGVPEGWKIIRVNDHFDALIASLERAEGKGYLPDAIAEEWENFACDENVAVPAAPAPVVQSAGVPDDIAEGLEILDNFIASVRENGNYSTEATLTFIGQARQCFASAPAPVSAPAPDREQATLCEDGGKCGIGGYCGQCEKLRAASDPEQPSEPDYTDCCDTPSLCSSVRRCTAQDAPRARGAACPHGVDDGACKQCYGEATRGEKGAESDQNSAKHRYFVYDPEGNGFDLYDTDAQREAAHLAAIAEARQAAMDDGEWALDVERIVSGFVTHTTVAAEMDGGGCDYAPLSAFNASAPALGEAIYQHDQGDGFWKDVPYAEWQLLGAKWRRIVYTTPASAPALGEQYTDDLAVDSFARAMKEKMAAARAKGRSGWEGVDPAELSRMLREHVEKGDPRDVANFCMMLWYHGAQIASRPQAAEPKGMTEEQRKSLEHAIWNFDRNRFVEDARNLRALLANGE